MPVELIAFIGAVGITATVFAIIVLLSEKPIKAFIMALISMYLLLFAYLHILEKLGKRKEKKHDAE
jgi:hypothetical protein